jgi:hypothetical protein
MRLSFLRILFFVLLYAPVFTMAQQNISKILQDAFAIELKPDESNALKKYKEVLAIQPTNLVALCKSSELCCRIGQRQTTQSLKENYYLAAKIYAETAIKIDSSYSNGYAMLAMSIGRRSIGKPGKQKVEMAKDLKKYCDLAIKYDANNYLAYHILARWHYELSNLNSLEKAAIKIMYGSLPAASIKSSILLFEKAKILQPLFVLNYYELARAYLKNSQKHQAKMVLDEMQKQPNVTEDDADVKESGKKLLLSIK